jgi:hypothetical protein
MDCRGGYLALISLESPKVVMYATTPDDVFKLPETCRDVRV